MTEPDFRPPSQQRKSVAAGSAGSTGKWLTLVVLVAAVAFAAWWLYARNAVPPPVPVTPPAAAPLEPVVPPVGVTPSHEPAPADTAQPVTEAPAQPLHPVPVEAADAVAPDDASALEAAVSEWLGREKTLQFVAIQGLAHHIVATVDNLPRNHAAPRLWPLHPVGGRMAIAQDANGATRIAPANASRYDALVGFVGAIDFAQAAALYRKVYPALQHAYENLGFPGKHFNDRLIEVIDHLLQTPKVTGPLAVKLVQVQTPEQPATAPLQPWLRYEYADPQLQSLSAGQRILLRIGPAHASTVQAQLMALRKELARPAP